MLNFIFGTLEPVFNVGNLITIFVTVGTIIFAAWRISIRLVRIETQNEMKIEMMWKQFCKEHKIDHE